MISRCREEHRIPEEVLVPQRRFERLQGLRRPPQSISALTDSRCKTVLTISVRTYSLML
jgi:hypothetical protein